MKKKLLFILIVSLFLFTSYSFHVSAQEDVLNITDKQEPITAYSSSYVYTFKGNAVSVLILSEFPQEDINKYNSEVSTNFPLATRLRSASKVYNCHSYAWYSQSTDNSYWMDDPSMYYTDGSYVEVSTPQVGDRICYFDKNLIFADVNLHSGIVTEVLSGTSNGVCGDSNLVMVTSKWGPAGLYLHRGDQCPYTSYSTGGADYVKYYRHIHEFQYKWKTDTKHYAGCYCGSQSLEAHAVKKGTTTCIRCGGKASIGFEEIGVLSKNIKRSRNGSYILPNGVIVLVDKDIEFYLSDCLEFYEDGSFLDVI